MIMERTNIVVDITNTMDSEFTITSKYSSDVLDGSVTGYFAVDSIVASYSQGNFFL